MTLGEAVKQRRKAEGLSQRDLAAMLDVSDMTISRLEANQNIRINRNIVDKLSFFLGYESIQRITGEGYFVNRLREYVENPLGIPNYERIGASYAGSTFLNYEDEIAFRSRLITLIESHNIPVEPFVLPYPYWETNKVDICFQYESKLWAIDQADKDRMEQQGKVTAPVLFERIGRAAFVTEINKYSIIIDSDLGDNLWRSFSGLLTKQLNFDVSILLYNRQKNHIENEIDLAFHDDGRGFFDLNVPGKEAESAKLYAAWKSSFAKQY